MMSNTLSLLISYTGLGPNIYIIRPKEMVKYVLVCLAPITDPLRWLHVCPGFILTENCGHDVKYLITVDKVYWAWCPYSGSLTVLRGTDNHLFLDIWISDTWFSCTGKDVSRFPYNVSQWDHIFY